MFAAQEPAAQKVTAGDFFVADWLVHPSLGTITRHAITTHLEPKTMQVLTCLASHAGDVVSKDELLTTVWPKTFVTEHVLSQAIWQLRQAFNGTEIVQTIPRRGYRLVSPVRPMVPPIRSIAVLPLANLSADPEQEFFADGTTDALIGALAQIGRLRVISRTSSMQYKGTTESVPQIARRLGVDAVVEGSVVRADGRVRIIVQLILAATDEHLWVRTYDRELRDILNIQDEVVRAIASEVRVTLTADEELRLTRSRPVKPAAHEAYLKGRYCYFRMSDDGLRMSMEHMRHAIECDPMYAPAYTGLASAVAVLSRMSLMVPEEASTIIRPAIARALVLDPSLSEAHCVLGGSRLYYDWNWAGAEQALRHAIGLNPSSSVAFGALAELHEALNQSEEAIRCWTQACKLDPLSVFFPALLGGTLVLARRPQLAVEQLRAALRQEPHYWLGYEILSFALADLGLYAEAIDAAQTAVRLSPDPIPRTALGYVCARAGRTAEARRILDDFDQLSKSRYVSPLVFAALLASLGNRTQALDYLEKGCVVRDPVVVLLRSFPFWRPLHNEPRFQAIVDRLKFPD